MTHLWECDISNQLCNGSKRFSERIQFSPNENSVSVTEIHAQKRELNTNEYITLKVYTNKKVHFIHNSNKSFHLQTFVATKSVSFLLRRITGRVEKNARRISCMRKWLKQKFNAMHLSADEISFISQWNRMKKQNSKKERTQRIHIEDTHMHIFTRNMYFCYVKIINFKIGFIKMYEIRKRIFRITIEHVCVCV